MPMSARRREALRTLAERGDRGERRAAARALEPIECPVSYPRQTFSINGADITITGPTETTITVAAATDDGLGGGTYTVELDDVIYSVRADEDEPPTSIARRLYEVMRGRPVPRLAPAPA